MMRDMNSIDNKYALLVCEVVPKAIYVHNLDLYWVRLTVQNNENVVA